MLCASDDKVGWFLVIDSARMRRRNAEATSILLRFARFRVFALPVSSTVFRSVLGSRGLKSNTYFTRDADGSSAARLKTRHVDESLEHKTGHRALRGSGPFNTIQQKSPETGATRPIGRETGRAGPLNKNQAIYTLSCSLSPGLDNSTGNSTAILDRLLDRIARQLGATRQTSTATRQLLDRTPLTPCDGGVKCQARQLDSSTDLDRPRQTLTRY